MTYNKKMLVSAIVPLLVFALAALNNFLSTKGLPCIQIGDDALTQAVSSIVEYLSAVWAWWRNNNVSLKAQQAQVYLDKLRDG